LAFISVGFAFADAEKKRVKRKERFESSGVACLINSSFFLFWFNTVGQVHTSRLLSLPTAAGDEDACTTSSRSYAIQARAVNVLVSNSSRLSDTYDFEIMSATSKNSTASWHPY